jgi:hypothetical protein
LNTRIAGGAFLLIALIAAQFLAAPTAAQNTYWIATEGLLWPNPLIQINIPSSQTVLGNDLPQAMTIWNDAIRWFESTYYPLNRGYTFIPSPNGAGVTIRSVDLQTLQSFCPYSTSGVRACTDFVYDRDSQYIEEAYVEILTSNANATTPSYLYDVVVALGTLLGLIQYPTPCPLATDLMCGNRSTLSPSTLDLYAIHLLANGKPVTTVHLPENIPYQQFQAVPTPEFQSTWSVLAFIILFSTLVMLPTGRRRKLSKTLLRRKR